MPAPISDITEAQVQKVYSGKPGCGCGCRGTYWEDARNVRRVLKVLQSRPDEVNVVDCGDTFCYGIDGEDRYYWVYAYKPVEV